MHKDDQETFSKLMRGTFDVYGKPMPESDTMRLWWVMLAAYDIRAVSTAFGRHLSVEKRFAPTVAQILDHLGANEADQRPGSDEAWATALLARDEAATVVWTTETAQAFAGCQTILRAGDEIGARMAFRQIYDRLVAASKAAGQPVKWSASLGHDHDLQHTALTHAQNAGLLPAATVALLLPAPTGPETQTLDAQEQLAKVKALLAEQASRREERAAQREREAQAKREQIEQQKRQINDLVHHTQERT